MLKLKMEVANHFFGAANIAAALAQPISKPSMQELPKVRIKFFDANTKCDRIATILEITEDEKLRVVEDGPNQAVVEIIDPKVISGIFITNLGRELEVSFGVGKVSVTSLIDENYR